MSYGQQPPEGQPPYGAPQYGAPQYGVPPYATPPTSGKATTSLVLGIASLVMCGLVLGIPAMIIARGAKKEIAASNGAIGGDGLATAGFVTGLIGTIWSVLALVLVIGVFTFGSVVSTQFDQNCTSVTDEGGLSVECG